MIKKVLFVFSFFSVLLVVGQNDYKLDEVVVNASKKLKSVSLGQKIASFSDSVIHRNTESFTDLLRFNTALYLKEYGKGGTSSISFRGTSASNTAVVWNGININSVNNGQTGFNSLTVNLFDKIDIRSGGGSIEFGSGAIGGTIHLNDVLSYSEGINTENQLVLTGGSYSTFNSVFKTKISNNKNTFVAGISRSSSSNDYRLFGTDFNNSNGAYENYSANLGFGFRLSKKAELKFHSSSYVGNRQFSGTLPNPVSANEKFKDISSRNLLIFGYKEGKSAHEVKVAYLTQKYLYYPDKFASTYNFGESGRYIIAYNIGLPLFDNKAAFNSYSEYESTFGRTDRINRKNRNQVSQSIIYNQRIGKLISYNLKVRKDFNSDFKVPFVYAGGIEIKPIPNYYFRINGSKNYRVPTYNDLYWPGQGNVNLIPETAKQGEIGIGYQNKKLSLDIGAYYINTKDKIVWTPSGDPQKPGVWVPINIEKTNNKGFETNFKYDVKIRNYSFKTNLNYSYTLAKNTNTDKYLVFVPNHMANGNLTISRKNLTLSFQALYNGKVYTTEDNEEDYVVHDFFVMNTLLEYKIKKYVKGELVLGVKVNNVLGEKYMVIPRRPMPLRNFNININYKFK